MINNRRQRVAQHYNTIKEMVMSDNTQTQVQEQKPQRTSRRLRRARRAQATATRVDRTSKWSIWFD